jgi:chemotaxis protein CheY-P-specific phosphatase CheC
MKKSIVVCDDSSLAQKMLIKSLPNDWNVDITLASNGQEALDAVRNGLAEYMFLDLNMPVMDGYQTLAAIQEEQLSSSVIVVSGDVQPEAYKRVMDLGAIAFIKKPINSVQVKELLKENGAYTTTVKSSKTSKKLKPEVDIQVSLLEGYQEVSNVAVGQAADLLARLLDVFVLMPIPQVNMLDPGELHMAIESTVDSEHSYAAICQGFIGSGISGEALLIFYESSIEDIAKLLKFKGDLTESAQLELVMDISSVLIGACLRGLSQQLDLEFSQSHPAVLGRHMDISQVISIGTSRWKQTLAIEVNFAIEGHDIQCDLLMLFTEESIQQLKTRLSYIL